MTETLVVIDAPHFYAGIVAQEGKVVEVAPILYRHIRKGWTGQQVADYCAQKGWHWERISTTIS